MYSLQGALLAAIHFVTIVPYGFLGFMAAVIYGQVHRQPELLLPPYSSSIGAGQRIAAVTVGAYVAARTYCLY